MATITSPRPQSPASSVRTPQLPQSPALTPASSVRASLDLPAGARPSSPAPGNPAQRRNRAALRDYYNIKGKGPPSQTQGLSRTASITSTTSDGTITSATTLTNDCSSILPPELDDATFDAEAYVQSLLRTSNLKDILRTEATLVSEIKNLDGERKALVYDNYSKLIKATQTIGNMQKSMNEGNLGNLEKLKPAVEEITRVAGELDKSRRSSGSGSGDRKSVKLDKQKKELVRWIVGAPSRFESYAEMEKNEELQLEWEIISNTLDKWRGVGGVEQIRTKCEHIMKQASSTDG